MNNAAEALSDPRDLPNGRRMSAVCGIDPGISGALGLLTLGGGYKFVDARDMPTVDVGKQTRVRRVNTKAVAAILKHWSPAVVVLERAWAMPRRTVKQAVPCPTCKHVEETGGMGATSAFNYGDTYGSLRTLVEALGFELLEVEPSVWKRAAGLKGKGLTTPEVKEASRQKAIAMWPEGPFGRLKDHARAEALLIARYGLARQVRLF